MSNWANKWPPDPVRPRIRTGDRVRFQRRRGTVADSWRSPRGYEREGEEFLRIVLDNGIKLTCKASEVRPA